MTTFPDLGAVQTPPNDDGAQTVMLADTDAWADFANANRDAIMERVGDMQHAYNLACSGGLILGGGAAPLFHIRFEG